MGDYKGEIELLLKKSYKIRGEEEGRCFFVFHRVF